MASSFPTYSCRCQGSTQKITSTALFRRQDRLWDGGYALFGDSTWRWRMTGLVNELCCIENAMEKESFCDGQYECYWEIYEFSVIAMLNEPFRDEMGGWDRLAISWKDQVQLDSYDLTRRCSRAGEQGPSQRCSNHGVHWGGAPWLP